MANDQQVRGTMDKGAGKVKETVGRVTGDPQTEAEGQNQQVEGQVRQTAGNVKQKTEHAGDRVQDGARRVKNAVTGNDDDMNRR
ncbi:MAG TPA: CsbD family protein [Chloroflexota bacterium]|nr:CsbD family protein [Chloroflexota bacterium]